MSSMPLAEMPSLAAPLHLKATVEQALDRAMRAGATDAEVVAYEGDEFGVRVRLGEVEELTEAGSRALGLRVFFAAEGGGRTATTSTSDLSDAGVARLVSGAVGLAKVTGVDPFAGLPDRAAFGSHDPLAQGLFFEDANAIPPPERIEIARRAEAAALAHDTRIQNSKGGSFDCSYTRRVMANSRGFTGDYRRSYCGFSASPIAGDSKGMQGGYWYSTARTARLLEDPESIGRIAAGRALRLLGARRVPTQQCPVIFPPESARGLMGNLLGAANGDAIYRNASMFAGKLGEQVAGENITMIDDGTLVFDHTLADGTTLQVGGFGTSPFDGDGLPTRRTVVIERGVLKSLMLNTYTGRKLGMASNAKATRGLAGTPGIGGGNYFLEPGTQTHEQIVGDVKQGLLVLSTMGFGVNLVTGDYSQGATGLWIENGEIAFPVEEITIAGNLKQMFRNVSAIGNDLEWRGSGAVPTVRIEGMTVAGS